jgi:hypothetical protein
MKTADMQKLLKELWREIQRFEDEQLEADQPHNSGICLTSDSGALGWLIYAINNPVACQETMRSNLMMVAADCIRSVDRLDTDPTFIQQIRQNQFPDWLLAMAKSIKKGGAA